MASNVFNAGKILNYAGDTRASRHEPSASRRYAAMMTFAAMTAVAPGLVRANPITSPAFPGKCVEAHNQGQTLEHGASLRLADCNGSAEQDFRFDPGGSALTMPGLAPALCLDLRGPPRNGEPVAAALCDGGTEQRWTFPFDGRLRPVGVDANKCLTHATRAGKPPTGWTFDWENEFDCELPDDLSGGGGFCIPAPSFFWEMMIASCNGANVQQWRLQQEGFPFPQDGIVSRRTHVAFDTMHIDDCREGGACDWRLHCGIGNEADVELLGQVEMNTGGTIAIGRSLIHEGHLPVTVTCHVREFDRGLFDPDVWEVVGTVTRTFDAQGRQTIGMDNDEGKVTINFDISVVGVIQQPATIEPPPALPTKIDGFDAMRLIGVTFSVPEAELRQWLGNPQHTPYPAIAGALLKLLDGRRLRRPVDLDVIVYNYEHAPGASSPRKMAEVDLGLLASAILEGHNKRYGESVSDVQRLID